MAINTANGKAFEYACLLGLHDYLNEHEQIEITDSPQFRTAKKFFTDMPKEKQQDLYLAGRAAARIIIRLEPQLKYPQANIPLFLCIQPDSKGIVGDVRDVICIRRQNNWEIGISCKHNHHAVKHSRLSDSIDFGEEWFDIPCTQDYWNVIKPLFANLREIRDSSRDCPIFWKDIPNKVDGYYRPLLSAFIDELRRLCGISSNVPTLLVEYLIGKYDFYKVISDDRHRTTRIEAVNIAGTLNLSSGKHKSIVDVAPLKLPTRFFHIDFVPNSDNTIEIICDNGWEITMRIHNASSRVEPSLKFDVNLQSMPSTIHTQVEPW